MEEAARERLVEIVNKLSCIILTSLENSLCNNQYVSFPRSCGLARETLSISRQLLIELPVDFVLEFVELPHWNRLAH